MKYFWIILAVLVFGCGDATNFGKPSTPQPETKFVTLGSVSLPWNEKTASLRVDLDGLERSKVRAVRVFCEGDCISLDGVMVWDYNQGAKWIGGHTALLSDGIPLDLFRGEWQEIQFSASSSMRSDLDFEVVAEILK